MSGAKEEVENWIGKFIVNNPFNYFFVYLWCITIKA